MMETRKRITDYIDSLDQLLFHLADQVWVNPLLDRLMLALSAAGRLGSLWLVLLGATVAVGKKTGRSVAFAGLVALAAGFAASDLVKELTMRPRPLLSLPDMRLLVSLPHSSYASPSGHATSAVASASGAILAAKRLLGRWPL